MLKSIIATSAILASSTFAFAANDNASCQGQFNGFVNEVIGFVTDSNGGGLGLLKKTDMLGDVPTNEVAQLRNGIRNEVCSNAP